MRSGWLTDGKTFGFAGEGISTFGALLAAQGLSDGHVGRPLVMVVCGTIAILGGIALRILGSSDSEAATP